tara:strand:+ start:1423 stop:1869 length:447 start_codon:yes stop_codon:yes gene_type:complete
MTWRNVVKKEDELKNWNVTVPYVLWKTFGPIEAYDEDEAIGIWNKNRRKYRSLGDGDLGSPVYDYSTSIWEAEATEVNKIVKKDRETYLQVMDLKQDLDKISDRIDDVVEDEMKNLRLKYAQNILVNPDHVREVKKALEDILEMALFD